MPKLVTDYRPFKALLEREGFDLDRTTEITGYSLPTIKKAMYEKSPRGWLAFVIELDRLHRITKSVIEAENELLKARLAELEAKHGA